MGFYRKYFKVFLSFAIFIWSLFVIAAAFLFFNNRIKEAIIVLVVVAFQVLIVLFVGKVTKSDYDDFCYNDETITFSSKKKVETVSLAEIKKVIVKQYSYVFCGNKDYSVSRIVYPFGKNTMTDEKLYQLRDRFGIILQV